MLVHKLNCQGINVISVVGGGGKTSTIRRLAQELNSLGKKVIVTTTTRLGAAEALSYKHRLLTSQFPPGKDLTNQELPDRELLLVGSVQDADKFVGIAPEEVDLLHGRDRERYLLVEADGAAKKPFKAPAAQEPVIPRSSQLVIAVVGAWALGLPLNADYFHRPHLIARLTGLSLDEPLTVEAAATVILHREGYRKGIPAGAGFAVLINGIDANKVARARQLAKYLKQSGVERVLLTNVRQEPPVVEAIV
ncbi:MAG: putative selenium-dependent hydroxylase accessory protein YqeC [Clostridia bacterium]|nr:putative selenium-dependent hydroxylase accessory protein YqeC [Clostridia bacterium]